MPIAEKLRINKTCLYHENDPKHNVHQVHQWLVFNCPYVMKMLAQYPDIYIFKIYNLSIYLKNRVHKHQIGKKNNLQM